MYFNKDIMNHGIGIGLASEISRPTPNLDRESNQQRVENSGVNRILSHGQIRVLNGTERQI